MSTPTEQIVFIRGTKVPVPAGLDAAALKRAVLRIDQRLEEIQQATLKTNTYVFALRLALELTLELHEQEAAHKSDIHDLLRQLSKLNETIEHTLESLEAGGRP